MAYGQVFASKGAILWRNLNQAESFTSKNEPTPMELFPTNKNRGQPYG